jgi:hypothetical protein
MNILQRCKECVHNNRDHFQHPLLSEWVLFVIYSSMGLSVVLQIWKLAERDDARNFSHPLYWPNYLCQVLKPPFTREVIMANLWYQHLLSDRKQLWKSVRLECNMVFFNTVQESTYLLIHFQCLWIDWSLGCNIYCFHIIILKSCMC